MGIAPSLRQACAARVESVVRDLRLGPIAQVDGQPAVVADHAGWVNPCFFVTVESGRELVIRFNGRDHDVRKFSRELAAFELLSALAVPRVVAYQVPGSGPASEILVCERLPGRNLESDWPGLDSESRRALAYDAGRALASIHNSSRDHYGHFGEAGPEVSSATRRGGHAASVTLGGIRSPSWTGFLETWLDALLLECDELSVLGSATLEQIHRRLVADIHRLGYEPRPTLVHGDFHLGNLLYRERAITGVLDFEWSLVGDPLWDLEHVGEMDRLWPESEAPFVAGYRSLAGDQVAWDARIALYRRLRQVEGCLISALHFPDETAQRVAALERDLG